MPTFCLKPHIIQYLIFTEFSAMPLPIMWWQYSLKSVMLLRNTYSAFTVFYLYRKYIISQTSHKSVFKSITVGPSGKGSERHEAIINNCVYKNDLKKEQQYTL